MTQSDFNTKYGRIAMPMPFAGATGAALASIAHTSGSVVNFPDGFPQNYSAPHSKGGKYITRGEMNAIGHLATVEGFYRQCGGLNLFDQELCNCIGGYPAGAVLDYLSGRKIYKILSLKDNNKVDFTGATPKYPDIVSGSVDNVNWIALNQDDSDIGRQIAFRFNFDGDSSTSLGRFVSSMTSPTFKVENNLLKSQETSGPDITIQCQNAGGMVSYVNGFCFAVKDLGTSVPSTDPIGPSMHASWNPITSIYSGTSDSNGWCALANFNHRYTSICWNAVTESVRAISVREFSTSYAYDIFPGFTKDHYYEIRCFGNCESHLLVRQERQNDSSESATIAYSKFKISGNLSLMY